MIENFRYYNQHTLIGVISEGIPPFVPQSIDALINHVASHIFQALLFYLHNNVFMFGFVCGFIFDEQVLELKQKVETVYEAQKTLLEKIFFIVGGGFLVILTKSTSLPIASLYTGCQLGAILYKNCKSRYSEPN